MSAPIPVILCGSTAPIAKDVIAELQPEYEVIHMIESASAGEKDGPSLLRGDGSTSDDAANIGTKNYSLPPAAVILGRGYRDTQTAAMKEACHGDSKVPWLRADLSMPGPALGQDPLKAMVQRVKALLEELKEKGKINEDGVYFY